MRTRSLLTGQEQGPGVRDEAETAAVRQLSTVLLCLPDAANTL